MSCCKECEDKGPDVTCAPCGYPQPAGLTYSTAWQRRGIGNPNDVVVRVGADPTFATPAETAAYEQGYSNGWQQTAPWFVFAGGVAVAAVFSLIAVANRGRAFVIG